MRASTEKNKALNASAFRALIEHAHEGIVVYDLSGKIKFATKSLKTVCGYSEKDVLGKTGPSFLHKDDRESARELFRNILKSPGKSGSIEQRIRHKRGHYIWVESTLSNFTHLAEVNGVVSNFRDITDRKVAEEKAQQSQELLATINRNLSEGTYLGIIGQKFIHVNDSFLRMFGYTSMRDLQRIKPSSVYASISARNSIVKELKSDPILRDKKTLFKRKDGSTFWGILNLSLLAHEGKQNYFVGTVRDITSEQQTEAALLSSRNLLDNIIHTVAAPIFVKNERFRWVMFNKKFIALIGRSEAELYNKIDDDFFSKKEVDIFRKIDEKVLRTGVPISNFEKITLPNGAVHEFLTVKSRYINEKKEKFIIGFITDITQLKKAEEKISTLNANLQGIIESTKESIYAVDNNFNYITFNDTHRQVMKTLYNVDVKEGKNKLTYLKGTRDHAWIKLEVQKALDGHHFISEHQLNYPGYLGYIRSTFNPIRDSTNKIIGAAVFVTDITERKRFEEIIKSANANLRGILESTTDYIIAIDRNLNYITFNKAYEQNLRDLLNADNIRFGGSFIHSFPPASRARIRKQVKRALGGEQLLIEDQLISGIFFEIALNPIRNESGYITGLAIFARDITQRKNIEAKMTLLNEELTAQNIQLAAQEEELKATLDELSERNFELDQIMYKTSHDLRSPLSSIMGLVNLSNLDPDPTNQRHYLNKIEGRIKKLDEFIRSMLDYARVNRTDVVFGKVDLQQIALSCIQELEYLENFKSLRTVVNVKSASAEFITDPLRANIIFGNIISNAYKYYNHEVSSTLTITLSVTDDGAVIEFDDNGIGIREEHHAKIFNMFYRATERSQGSGLGMYIVKQAVEKLRGTIVFKSQYGSGTHIMINLPSRIHW